MSLSHINNITSSFQNPQANRGSRVSTTNVRNSIILFRLWNAPGYATFQH